VALGAAQPSSWAAGNSPCLTMLRGECQVNQTSTSIFDLSPSEKLQLVEDLWDGLAATPKAVPVHDWHKEKLAR